nr:Ppx/GppA phosphatase family protein [Stappia sp. ES.058]
MSVDGIAQPVSAENGPGPTKKRRGKRRRKPNRAERRAEKPSSPHLLDTGVAFGTPARLHAPTREQTAAEDRARDHARSIRPAAGGQIWMTRSKDGARGQRGPDEGQEQSHRAGRGAQRVGAPAGFDPASAQRLYAALDLGTNNCRLLVARPEIRGFRVVDAFSKIVRLGEGLSHNNRLGEAAMDRAIEALGCCRDKMRDRGVDRVRLIATEACRAAENGPLFIERVFQETGLALEIATRETEARLAVAGCASLVDPDANGVVLFDIGGGSSEIVWLDLRNRCGARGVALTRFIRDWTSLPVGVVNLAERHGGRHVSADTFEAMVQDARQHLEAFSLGRELTDAICDGKVHMLGTSGTVTTLAGVHFGLKRYDRRRVDGAWMDADDVTAMIERLRAMPYEERVGNPCIGADRADLVLAGCAILEAIRRRWPCQRLRVADRGLREGILMELMSADRVWRRKDPPKYRGRGRKQK